MAKRRVFRLAALLRMRTRREQTARAELGQATVNAEQAREVLHERFAELSSMDLSASTHPQHFLAAVAARASMSSLVKEARAQAAVADEEQHRTTQAWQGARTDLKVMQRLQEHHQDGQRRADRAAEQSAADDRPPRPPQDV